MEPTWGLAIISWIGSLIFVLLLAALALYMALEHRRTKRYPTKNEWAYGDKRYGYELKFITGTGNSRNKKHGGKKWLM